MKTQEYLKIGFLMAEQEENQLQIYSKVSGTKVSGIKGKVHLQFK